MSQSAVLLALEAELKPQSPAQMMGQKEGKLVLTSNKMPVSQGLTRHLLGL